MRLHAIVLSLVLCVAAAPGQVLEQADQARRDGDFDRAEQLYRQFLDKEPGSFAGNYNLGALLAVSRPADAIPWLEKAKAIAPGRAEPYISLATVHLVLGRADAAYQTLLDGEEVCAPRPDYWATRFSAALALRNAEDGKRSAHEFVRRSGNTPAAASAAAAMVWQFGDREAAERFLRAATEAEPGNPRYAADLGVALISMGRGADAIAYLESAVRRMPSEQDLALVYAAALLQERGISEALDSLIEAQARGADGPALRVQKGDLLLQLERADEAMAEYEAVLQQDPDNRNARLRRGQLLLKKGDAAGALEDATAATEGQNLVAESHLLRHDALMALGRKNEAEVTLRIWLARAPGDAYPLTLLAQRLMDREAFAEAVTVLEAFLDRQPGHKAALETLARAYAGAGMTDRAIERLRNEIDAGVKSAELYVRLALAHRRIGQNSQTLGVLREMTREHPADPRGWLLQASTHEAAGNMNGALAVYEDMLAAHPGNPTALEGAAKALASLGRHEEAAQRWIQIGDGENAPLAYLFASRSFVLAGKTEAADKLWLRLVSENPDKIDYLSAYAEYLGGVSREEEALAVYRKMTVVEPAKPAGYLGAHRILSSLDRHGEAADLLASGLPRLYGEPGYVQLLNISLNAAGRNDEYLVLLERLLDEGLVSEQSVLAYVGAMHKAGKADTAEKRLGGMSLPESDWAPLWLGLSRSRALQGDDAGALAAFEMYAELMPRDVPRLRAFAAAAEAVRDPARAARAYGLLAAAIPEDENLVLKQASYLLELGRKEEARSALNAALQRMPGQPEITEMLRTISLP